MKAVVSLKNSEKVRDCAVTLFDQKGKAIAGPAPDGLTVAWTQQDSTTTIAQLVQDPSNPIGFDVTTEGDDIGVVTFSADITRADGTKILDSDGNPPSLEVTVTNSAPNTAGVSVGTVQPE